MTQPTYGTPKAQTHPADSSGVDRQGESKKEEEAAGMAYSDTDCGDPWSSAEHQALFNHRPPCPQSFLGSPHPATDGGKAHLMPSSQVTNS